MNFDETLRLKALQLKQTTHGQGDLQDRLVDDLMKRDGGEFRNMCAHISPQLFEEIQGLCKTLDISQRRFVEGALIEAVKRANSIIAEVQPFELEG
jgi:hypothetical protein